MHFGLKMSCVCRAGTLLPAQEPPPWLAQACPPVSTFLSTITCTKAFKESQFSTHLQVEPGIYPSQFAPKTLSHWKLAMSPPLHLYTHQVMGA